MPKTITITDEIFLEALVRHGYNAAKAYSSLKPGVSKDSAKTLGARKMAELKANDVYKSLLSKAFENVASLMESKNEEIKRKQTKDVIEWAHGKAKESVDLTSKGKSVGVTVYLPQQKKK